MNSRKRCMATLIAIIGMLASDLFAEVSERDTAKWVIDAQGSLRVELNGGSNQRVDKPEQIPADEFRVVEIQLNGKDVNDSDLPRLAELKSLRKLSVGKTTITDEGLRHVERIKTLESLDLYQTRITGAGLSRLSELKKLKSLVIAGVGLVDADLVHLARFKDLRELNIRDADITDAGILTLAQLKGLERLDLSLNAITDGGVMALEKFPRLQTLALTRVLMTDLGLVHLSQSLKLKELNVNGTLVSQAGVDAFLKARPQCKLKWDSSDIVTKLGSNGSLLDRRCLTLDEDLAAELEPGATMWRFERVIGSVSKPNRPIVPWALTNGKAAGVARSLSPWKIEPKQNVLAVGYLKIEQPGLYAFAVAEPSDAVALWIGTMSLRNESAKPLATRDLLLAPCYLPIAVAGFADGTADVTVQWRRPGEKAFSPIPSDLITYLPSSDADGALEKAASAPVVSKLSLPLPPSVKAPSAVRVAGLRAFAPVAIEQWCSGTVPEFLRGATIYAYPLRHDEAIANAGFVEIDVQQDAGIFIATAWDVSKTDDDRFGDLLRDLWVSIGNLESRDPGAGKQYVYWRKCKRGERLELRTDKYRPPSVIVCANASIDPLNSIPLPGATSNEAAMVIINKCRYLIRTERFDDLESMAADLRARRPSLKDGRSILARLYDGIEPFGTTDEQWEQQREIFQRWCEKKPDSITAHIALGRFWEMYAWRARGGGYARSVSADGAAKFNERVKLAQSVVEQARALKEKDSQLCDLEMQLAIDTGALREQVERIIQDALAIDPADRGVVIHAARYFYPRWYGRPGELEKYAMHAYQLTRKHWGTIVYGQIAWNARLQHGPSFLDDFNLSWDLVKQGLNEYTDRYTEMTAAQEHLARMACFKGDRETARAAFLKFDHPNPAVWPPTQYAAWRRWTQDDFFQGDQLEVFQASDYEVTQVRWTSDGKKIVTCDAYEMLATWSADTHKRLSNFEMDSRARTAFLVPSSTRLISADWNGDVYLQNYATGQATLIVQDKKATTLALSLDGKLLATTASDRQIRFWNLEKFSELEAWPMKSEEVSTLAFTDRGATLVVGTRNKQVSFWDVKAKQRIGELPRFERRVGKMCVSGDGRRLAVLCGNQLSMWQLPERTPLGVVEMPRRSVNEIVLSSDGSRLAVATGAMSPSVEGDVLLWDTDKLKLLHTYRGHKAMVRSVSFSPDDKRLASGSDDMTVRLWNVD